MSDAIHDFTVLLRTDFDLTDISRFRIHAEINYHSKRSKKNQIILDFWIEFFGMRAMIIDCIKKCVTFLTLPSKNVVPVIPFTRDRKVVITFLQTLN